MTDVDQEIARLGGQTAMAELALCASCRRGDHENCAPQRCDCGGRCGLDPRGSECHT